MTSGASTKDMVVLVESVLVKSPAEFWPTASRQSLPQMVNTRPPESPSPIA
jgi:hypothetical protein